MKWKTLSSTNIPELRSTPSGSISVDTELEVLSILFSGVLFKSRSYFWKDNTLIHATESMKFIPGVEEVDGEIKAISTPGEW